MTQALEKTESTQTVRPGTREGRSGEVRLWYFMRISGLILLFLALIHFAITHIVNDVIETDFTFVQARWSNPLWRLFDWVLLTLALGHGIIGVRAIIEDYVRNPRRRVGVKALLYVVVGVLFALGTLTIVTFQA